MKSLDERLPGERTGKVIDMKYNSETGVYEADLGLKRTSNKRGSKKGFTLIEIIATIGIVTILGGIIGYCSSKAKARSTQMTCMGNMKQILSAMEMYHQDQGVELYSRGAPMRIWTPTLREQNLGLLYPYLKNLDVFFCAQNPNFDADNPDHGKDRWGNIDPLGGPVDGSYTLRSIHENGGKARIADVYCKPHPNDPPAVTQIEPHEDGVFFGYNDGSVRFERGISTFGIINPHGQDSPWQKADERYTGKKSPPI